MKTSDHMQRMVVEFVRKFGTELDPDRSSPTAGLELRLEGKGYLLIALHMQLPWAAVRRYYTDADAGKVTHWQGAQFFTSATEWVPFTREGEPVGRADYGELADNGQRVKITDAEGQAALAEWTEELAEELRAEDWLGKAEKVLPFTDPAAQK